jgi:hypothetical protein
MPFVAIQLVVIPNEVQRSEDPLFIRSAEVRRQGLQFRGSPIFRSLKGGFFFTLFVSSADSGERLFL